MAHGFRRVPVATEVAAFERKIGGHQKLGTRVRAKDSAVITDAKRDGRVPWAKRTTADTLDQGELSQWFQWLFVHAGKQDNWFGYLPLLWYGAILLLPKKDCRVGTPLVNSLKCLREFCIVK